VHTAGVRRLTSADSHSALEAANRDPVGNLFFVHQLGRFGCGARWPEHWGYFDHGRIESLCFFGAAIVLTSAPEHAARAFAHRAVQIGRRFRTITAPRAPAEALWQRLEPSWGPSRQVTRHVLMTTDRLPAGTEIAAGVRVVSPREIDPATAACLAARQEEAGEPLPEAEVRLLPLLVAELVREQRLLALFDGGRAVFKAEITEVTPGACRLAGVWLAPELRGQGRSRAAIAAAVSHALRHDAPTVALDVDSSNTRALSAYRSLGFHPISEATSIDL